jgi:hypothetical protein
MKILPFKFALAFILLVSSQAALAQTNPDEPRIIPGDANSCELNSAFLDLLSNDSRANPNDRVFVIAHLGHGEMSRNLNRRRLHNVRTYLSGRIDANRIIFAESDPVNGDGRVEFYLGSKLIFVSLVKRGGDICVTCCDDDPAYYGLGKRDRRRKRKRQ